MKTPKRLISSLGVALTFSIPALASGPDNIHGLSGRLESITCRGAYTTSKSDAEGRIEGQVEASCTGLGTRQKYEECRSEVVRRLANPAPNAVLTGIAIDGKKTIQMNIIDNGRTALSSLRGITMYPDLPPARGFLRFYRDGIQGQDEYAANTSDLSEDGRSVTQISVPVHRRFASDRYYFFVDGCELSWSRD